MFKRISIQFFVIIFLCPLSGYSNTVPRFIQQNDLTKVYEIGSDFIDHYSENIFKATRPEWFSKFEAEAEMNLYRVGIPEEYQNELGYYKLLKVVNDFSDAAEKQAYRDNAEDRNAFIRAAVGLVLTIERASFHHISKVSNLQKMLEGIYLRNYFGLSAPEGSTKDPARFIWCYFVGKFFKFPLDIVSQGINELGLLKMEWRGSPDKINGIDNFISGYAAHGLLIDNRNLLIWGGHHEIAERMPLKLINNVLRIHKEDQDNERLKLWALQKKYLYLKKIGSREEVETIKVELLEIYKSKDLAINEHLRLFVRDLLQDWLLIMFFGSALGAIVLRPLLESIRNKSVIHFLSRLWNILSGKDNLPWQQACVVIIVFTLSLVFEDYRSYEPPIATFSLSDFSD